MKNQYFGDVTDYVKYGILNILASGGLTIAVHWTLTPRDGSNDGKYIKYLSNSQKWRVFAPKIFASLKKHVEAGTRDVSIVERDNYIADAPDAHFCYDDWVNDPNERMKSIKGFIAKLPEKSVIFLTPTMG